MKVVFAVALTLATTLAYADNLPDAPRTLQARHDLFLAQSQHIMEVNPYGYFKKYEGNPLAGDAAYKGQWFNLRGVVSRVEVDHYGEPVVLMVAVKGMLGPIKLRLFPEQIISHDETGYKSAPSSYVLEKLSANDSIVANCRGAGVVRHDAIVDNCLLYTTYTYNKIYNDQ